MRLFVNNPNKPYKIVSVSNFCLYCSGTDPKKHLIIYQFHGEGTVSGGY